MSGFLIRFCPSIIPSFNCIALGMVRTWFYRIYLKELVFMRSSSLHQHSCLPGMSSGVYVSTVCGAGAGFWKYQSGGKKKNLCNKFKPTTEAKGAVTGSGKLSRWWSLFQKVPHLSQCSSSLPIGLVCTGFRRPRLRELWGHEKSRQQPCTMPLAVGW